MSDSDNDLSDNIFSNGVALSSLICSSRNEGSIVGGNGPNININNLRGLSFRNNDQTSTLNMPSNMSYRNNEWQRHLGSNYNQRSMWSRRQTSPISTASACDARQRNYNNLFNSRALSSHRLNSERARSPPTMSLKSIDSNATNVTALDLHRAIKQFQGSEYEIKMLQLTLNKKLRKQRTRRGIEKRKNFRVFSKSNRRKSGNDSGELGSSSSLSSDDSSIGVLNYENMSLHSCRSTKTDIPDIRRNFKDCINRQNKMLSMGNGSTKLNSIRSSVSPSKSMINMPTIPKSLPTNITHNQSSMNQSNCYRDRLKNRFIIPCLRFNQSVAGTSKPYISSGHPLPLERISDDEDIFSNPTSSEKPTSSLRKRGIDRTDDIICLPNNKKPKVDIVQKDFKFVKPAYPVHRVPKVKSKEIIISTTNNKNPTEELISKSASPPPIQNNFEPEDEKEVNTELPTTSHNNTDVSLRPSFMKRKLFSQKMDVTEKINDIANSPQNSVYAKIQKEKNKVRKLVTSQSCLSRDIHANENNILDLIHKIVPGEFMNATAQSNKITTQNMSENKVNGDVTSIISARNNNEEDLSDTFTDEDALIACDGEVFSPKTVKKVCKSPLKNVQKSPQKPFLQKSPVKKLQMSPFKVSKLSKNVLAEKNGTSTKGVNKLVKNITSFWDTDIESENEITSISRKKIEKLFKENKDTDAALSVASTGLEMAFQCISGMNPVNNATMINTTVDSTQKFINTNSIFKLCSHRNSKPKKIVCEKINESTTQIKPLCLEQKNTKSNTHLKVTELENYTQPDNKKPVKPKLGKSKPQTKKSPPKKQSQAVKKNTHNTAKAIEIKKLNSINDKTTEEENTKSQNQKNKTESYVELNTTQDKKNVKKRAAASQNKIENNLNKTKQTRHDENSQNLIKADPQINSKASKSQKPDHNIKDKNINNIKTNIVKINTTKLSDSLIYGDSFTETNNNSIRPVRACRLNKQNNSLDTNKVNQTLNVTLRSRIKKPDVKKPAPKRSKSKEQANFSDLSFLEAQMKPISRTKSRCEAAEKIGLSDSDISFSLTDKDSRLKSRGKSADIRHAQTRMPLNKPNKKEFVSKEPRPVRTRISYRRYFS